MSALAAPLQRVPRPNLGRQKRRAGEVGVCIQPCIQWGWGVGGCGVPVSPVAVVWTGLGVERGRQAVEMPPSLSPSHPHLEPDF